MHGINNSGKLFAGELNNCLIDEAGFKKSKCKMFIFYDYAPDGFKLVVLYYADGCVYWYILFPAPDENLISVFMC